MLIAYHNNPALKAEHVAWIKADIAADRLIAGSYGERTNGNWRGCMWGCFLRSQNPHEIVEKKVGIPRQLSTIADGIFEALSRLDGAQGRQFALDFFEAIEPGAHLLIPYWRFMHWLLVDPVDGVLKFAQREKTRKAIQDVADLYERQLKGEKVVKSDWQDAAAAADAAYAAAAAADAAVAAAYAAGDVAAAYAAAAVYAAYAAAAADAAYAAYAAAAAARLKARVRQSEKLIELLKAAPMAETNKENPHA